MRIANDGFARGSEASSSSSMIAVRSELVGLFSAGARPRADTAGTRALIEILLAHRTMSATTLTAAMDRAVASGCLEPELVMIDARRDTTHVVPVIPIGALARYDRPTPTLVDYDQLLNRSAP
jgi:hypothetical protein